MPSRTVRTIQYYTMATVSFVLPLEDVKLGRLVVNTKRPRERYHDPNVGAPHHSSIQIKPSPACGTAYTLENPEFWLDKATSSRNTKEWIEKAALRGDNIFMIVGIRTNATKHSIQHEQVGHRSDSSKILLRYGENRFSHDSQPALVEYRKVSHRWLSSRVVDLELATNPRRWFCVVGGIGGFRLHSDEDGDDEDEDDEDVIEVNFENKHIRQLVVEGREQWTIGGALRQNLSTPKLGPCRLPYELWTKILDLMISWRDLKSWRRVSHEFAELLSKHRSHLAKKWEDQFRILQDRPLDVLGKEIPFDELNSYDSLAVLRAFLVCRLPRSDEAVRLGCLVSSRYSSQRQRRLKTLTLEAVYEYTSACDFFMENAGMVKILRTFYVAGNQPERLFRILEEEFNFIKFRPMTIITCANRAVQVILTYQTQSDWTSATRASLEVLDIIEQKRVSLISPVVWPNIDELIESYEHVNRWTEASLLLERCFGPDIPQKFAASCSCSSTVRRAPASVLCRRRSDTRSEQIVLLDFSSLPAIWITSGNYRHSCMAGTSPPHLRRVLQG